MSIPTNVQPSATPPKRLTWKICSTIVLLTMGTGLILATLRPFWLAPPWLQATPLVYLSLALAWLPVLGTCAILRPTGGWRNLIKLMMLGLLASLLWSVFSISSLGTEMLSPFRELKCHMEPLPKSRTRYTCTSTGILIYTTYVFEGPEGSPIVRLVERKEGSS